MSLWNRLRTPPPSALKTIKGGRLSGMSDIDPMWRWQALTEAFGPVGEGWRFEIVRLWTEPGTEGVVMCFAHVNLYVRCLGSLSGWSDAIPGVGGNALVAKERAGLHSNDEAYKMAITDALGTAGKMLGLAADVYMGRMDGSKYQSGAAQAPSAGPRPALRPQMQSQQQRPQSQPQPSPDAEWEDHGDPESVEGYPPDDAELDRQRGDPVREPGPDGRFPRGPNPDVPWCPECGKDMWDHREPERGGKGRYPKKNPRGPDFKCRDRACEGARWPQREGQS